MRRSATSSCRPPLSAGTDARQPHSRPPLGTLELRPRTFAHVRVTFKTFQAPDSDEDVTMANERLRAAMAKAGKDILSLACATEVDPKTVQRWLAGRVPHPRHRWAIASILDEEEGHLWPSARPDLSAGAEA